MPFVKVFLRSGKSEEYIKDIGNGIHEALVAAASVPADDRFQVFTTVPAAMLVSHPSYGGVSRSADLVIVEITLNAGRSLEVKKALYAAIARNLERAPGIRRDDVLISLVEVTSENWSFGKGIATYA